MASWPAQASPCRCSSAPSRFTASSAGGKARRTRDPARRFRGRFVAFRLLARLPQSLRARQLARTAEDIVELSDDVDPERDHIRDGGNAPVTLVEYGDYECPYCGQAESVVRELLRSFGNDLRYVWRQLPLTDVHPHAQIAAEATEAAAAQGEFWAMHDTLLAHQDELTTRDLIRHAESLGLETGRSSTELHDGTHAEHVAENVASADATGVARIPSFFINGKRHHGAYDIGSLSAAVRAAQSRIAARQDRRSESVKQSTPPAAGTRHLRRRQSSDAG